MIASEFTALTLDRTERVFLQRSIGGATLMSSSGAAFPMLPYRGPLISIRCIQKKQPTAPRHHATHN
jgi:hypothetical protein